jgi:hypothetical protein
MLARETFSNLPRVEHEFEASRGVGIASFRQMTSRVMFSQIIKDIFPIVIHRPSPTPSALESAPLCSDRTRSKVGSLACPKAVILLS